MQRNRKRKHQSEVVKVKEPYPDHSRPTPEECRSVRDSLLNLHGFPQEFLKYREIRSVISSKSLEPNQIVKSEPLEVEAKLEPIEVEPKLEPLEVEEESVSAEAGKQSVLDGLVNILLSQNTTEINAARAFASLKSAFPTWEDVLSAESKCIENAIKCGGLAITKASCIKNLLNGLLEKKGKLCLEYLRDMSVDEIKAELSAFKGIGPKTVACVLMFHLEKDDFPVDTHVFRITKEMGWIPASSDRGKAYLHLNKRIPDELKFDLNCLFVTHGKLCQRCTKKSSNQHSQTSPAHCCPLSVYMNK